jgi:hypothetical protein
MNSVDINNFRASAEVFSCASTPAYLYVNLKRLQEIEKLASELSTKDLYELCNQVLAKDTKNWDNELAFYIHLIALSFKTYSETRPYLLKLSKTNKYKWTIYIVSLIIADSKVVTEYKVTVKNKPKIVLPVELTKYDSITACEVDVKKEPQIIFPEEASENPATSSNVINVYREDKKND